MRGAELLTRMKQTLLFAWLEAIRRKIMSDKRKSEIPSELLLVAESGF